MTVRRRGVKSTEESVLGKSEGVSSGSVDLAIKESSPGPCECVIGKEIREDVDKINSEMPNLSISISSDDTAKKPLDHEFVTGLQVVDPQKEDPNAGQKPTTSEAYRMQFKKKNKVAIVGFADSWNQTPFNHPEFEVWGLNSLFEIIPRYDLWFETHEKSTWENNKEIGLGLTRNGRPYKEGLAALKCPVLMFDKYDDIPNSLRYPLEEMISKFDPLRRNMPWKDYAFKGSRSLDWNGYMTNSVSFMLALAIDWGYEEIHVYGVDMATTGGGEYASQRPSCEYYLGIAVGKGIKVFIPPQADLLKTRFIYGWEFMQMTNYERKIDKLNEAMGSRFMAAQQQFEMGRKQMDQYIGAQEALKEVKKIWSNCEG